VLIQDFGTPVQGPADWVSIAAVIPPGWVA